MIIISSREFRQNQRLYFEKVDQGEQVIVQRGRDKSYALAPVTEDDLYFNAAMIERIKTSLQEAASGEVEVLTTVEEIADLLRR